MTYSEDLTTLVVVAYPEQEKAKEVLKELKELQIKGIISIVNAAVMVKNEKGKLPLVKPEIPMLKVEQLLAELRRD